MATAPLPKVTPAAQKSTAGHGRVRNWLDRFGATGSLLCAAHCAALPLLIALVPALGVSLWLGEGFERGFVIFVTALGAFSLIWGWRRHRVVRALGVLALGLAVLWAGVLYTPLHESLLPHAVAMTLGGALVGLAHVINLRLNHGRHVHTASCVH
jgi:hypothetical protein